MGEFEIHTPFHLSSSTFGRSSARRDRSRVRSPARSTRPAAPRGCPGDAPLRTRGAARAREGGAGVRPRGPASPGGPRGTRPPSRADRDRLKEGRAAQLDPGSPPQPAAPHCRPTSAEAPHARAAPRARTPASLPATHPPCRKPRGFSRQPRSRSHALSLRSVSGKRLSRRRRREGLRSRPPLRQDCRSWALRVTRASPGPASRGRTGPGPLGAAAPAGSSPAPPRAAGGPAPGGGDSRCRSRRRASARGARTHLTALATRAGPPPPAPCGPRGPASSPAGGNVPAGRSRPDAQARGPGRRGAASPEVPSHIRLPKRSGRNGRGEVEIEPRGRNNCRPFPSLNAAEDETGVPWLPKVALEESLAIVETQTHFSSTFPFKGGSKRVLHEKMLQLKAGMQQPLEKGPAERRVDEQQTQPEEAGSSSVSHSGKYHSLIQDQARELTHLRQKMRMGRAFSSLLIQHVRNTMKTFEELLSSNKVDHYMEQHFREHLTKGSQLAESLASKFDTDACTHEKNEAGQMLRTLSILREMQKKGKVTEVLKTRQEAQPQTLCQIHSRDQAQSAAHFSSSSTSLLHEEQDVCPSMDVVNVSPATPADSASLLSNHSDARSTQPFYPLSGTTQLSGIPGPGHHGSSGLWDKMRPQKMNASGHLSSFSSSYQPNSKPSGADLLEKNLVEIQNLRQRLEESICINDRLQKRLEHVLSNTEQGKSTRQSIPGVSLATPHSYAQSHPLRSAQDVL
ncbi:translation initiation factor IF-2-like isoform X1 [Canis lupus familiaris]|nr:translation initiation factor IF-2-like isoform X1 [Canis lupus familiaris]